MGKVILGRSGELHAMSTQLDDQAGSSRKETMRAKIAVAGAGIYGATAAIRLAEQGHDVHLFDPLGIIPAAAAINQYRVHAGYHYPRSPETIQETMEARVEFIKAFEPTIVRNSRHYYAIPKKDS